MCLEITQDESLVGNEQTIDTLYSLLGEKEMNNDPNWFEPVLLSMLFRTRDREEYGIATTIDEIVDKMNQISNNVGVESGPFIKQAVNETDDQFVDTFLTATNVMRLMYLSKTDWYIAANRSANAKPVDMQKFIYLLLDAELIN